MLEFKTTANAKKAKAIKFTIDGDTFEAVPPKDTALAFLVASTASDKPGEQIREMLQFFRAVLKEPGRAKFFDKLRDPDDNLTLKDATDILTGLLEEFGGRPTE